MTNSNFSKEMPIAGKNIPDISGIEDECRRHYSKLNFFDSHLLNHIHSSEMRHVHQLLSEILTKLESIDFRDLRNIQKSPSRKWFFGLKNSPRPLLSKCLQVEAQVERLQLKLGRILDTLLNEEKTTLAKLEDDYEYHNAKIKEFIQSLSILQKRMAPTLDGGTEKRLADCIIELNVRLVIFQETKQKLESLHHSMKVLIRFIQFNLNEAIPRWREQLKDMLHLVQEGSVSLKTECLRFDHIHNQFISSLHEMIQEQAKNSP
ncbi:hypothetical protein [Falsibacillus albus]|uniref:Uncharacterized protein n=1 Tax=Falsibacillus albus TaxID=2478915 RepID=A0A3L7JYT0_9BACI|nr:hypothetical protein [Falsibacillus albus]RLQ95424.1 hypothetical protein D9X91_10330 [Falsibacillus albus]